MVSPNRRSFEGQKRLDYNRWQNVITILKPRRIEFLEDIPTFVGHQENGQNSPMVPIVVALGNIFLSIYSEIHRFRGIE